MSSAWQGARLISPQDDRESERGMRGLEKTHQPMLPQSGTKTRRHPPPGKYSCTTEAAACSAGAMQRCALQRQARCSAARCSGSGAAHATLAPSHAALRCTKTCPATATPACCRTRRHDELHNAMPCHTRNAQDRGGRGGGANLRGVGGKAWSLSGPLAWLREAPWDLF